MKTEIKVTPTKEFFRHNHQNLHIHKFYKYLYNEFYETEILKVDSIRKIFCIKPLESRHRRGRCRRRQQQ